MVIIAAACLPNFVIDLDGLDVLEDNDIVEDSDEDDNTILLMSRSVDKSNEMESCLCCNNLFLLLNLVDLNSNILK